MFGRGTGGKVSNGGSETTYGTIPPQSSHMGERLDRKHPYSFFLVAMH